MKKFSVVDNIDENYPPTYLVHGLGDRLVPFNQSVQMAEKLNANKVSYTLDLVPNVDHALDFMEVSPEIWKEHLLPVFDFAEKHFQKNIQVQKILT